MPARVGTRADDDVVIAYRKRIVSALLLLHEMADTWESRGGKALDQAAGAEELARRAEALELPDSVAAFRDMADRLSEAGGDALQLGNDRLENAAALVQQTTEMLRRLERTTARETEDPTVTRREALAAIEALEREIEALSDLEL